MPTSKELKHNHTYVINAPGQGDFHGERVTARPRGDACVWLHFHNQGSGTGSGDLFTHSELEGMEFEPSARQDDDDLYE